MANRKLRCFALKSHGQWQAFCVDLNLAAQGDTFQEVREKLNDMLFSYVELASEQDHADRYALLNRPAPFGIRARYALVYVQCHLDAFFHHRKDADQAAVSHDRAASWRSPSMVGGLC